jgi:hypothetical protein
MTTHYRSYFPSDEKGVQTPGDNHCSPVPSSRNNAMGRPMPPVLSTSISFVMRNGIASSTRIVLNACGASLSITS